MPTRPLHPLVTLPVLLGLLLACGPTIKGSTAKAQKASIERLEQGLSPRERREFEAAINYVVVDAIDRNNAFGAEGVGDAVDRDVYEFLDGKTAHEVIDAVASMRAERAARKADLAAREAAR